MAAKQFPCRYCGAQVEFTPGAATLSCPYCGGSHEIPQSAEEVGELDLHEHLQQASEAQETEERLAVTCSSCGAESTLEANVTSGACAFCGTNVVVTTHSTRLLKPKSLLPFKINRKQALESFRRWVRSRWFAPNKLKKIASTAKGIVGMYLPFWTYDCFTTSYYQGERGDDYTVRENDREETRTRWSGVNGVVLAGFDDVLISASDSLPSKHVNALEPWDLDQLVGYKDDYLAGFRAESYRIDLEQGFAQAKKVIDGKIRHRVAKDIGGDHQRIHSIKSSYDKITFKHILLPVWISAYRFNDTVFRFLVNARTGEVQGERPYSWIKITLAVLAGLLALGSFVMLSS